MKKIRSALLSLLALLVLSACGSGMSASAANFTSRGPIEHGTVNGWQDGDAVVYGTVGFFSPNPQIVAVGSIAPDGSLTLDYPALPPPDVLARPQDQCSTIQASNPVALTAFTGNDLVFRHGKAVGSVHSGSSIGVAAFTGIAAGDTRTGYVYASADTTQTGFCERTISFGRYTMEFRQNFDLTLHKGWNTVVARFSTPKPGQIISDLKLGSNPAEKLFFFVAPNQ